MNDTPQIFISYATPDRERVVAFHDHLRNRGYDVWMDFRQLKGGQNWDFEIKRALNRASLILMFISMNSVDRRGYVQREIKIALDKAQDKLIDDIYIIPVKIDEGAPIPEQLSGIHMIMGEDSHAFEQVEEAICEQLERVGRSVQTSPMDAGVGWSQATYREEWDGLPGYRTEFNFPRFTSDRYPKIGEITDVLKGALTTFAHRERRTKLFAGETYLNFGMDRFFRTNTWEAFCGAPVIKGRCVSIQYSVTWFGAGAAHPNYHFLTFCFVLDPLVQIESPESLFKKQDEALDLIRTEVRTALLAQDFSDDPAEPMKLDPEYVAEGTEKWSNFQNFTLGDDGITFLFGNYEVAPYVFGAQSATVPYEKLVALMHREFTCALDVDYLRHPQPQWDKATVEIVAESEPAPPGGSNAS